jgi:outer membrane immunogenic protein
MSKRIAFAVMLLLVASGEAFAADLPAAPPPPQAPVAYIPAAPPVYNWGGIYVGINGGWGFGNAKWTVGPLFAFPAGTSHSVSDNGGVVGGTLGANYQTGGLVIGVEGDWDYSGINTGTTQTICNVSGSCQTGNNWLFTARGRIGYAADRVLFFATAGGAFGSIKTTFSGIDNTSTQAGWTAGAGIEAAFADNWTAKIEYLYVDLGTWNGTCTTAACLAASPSGTAPVAFNVNLTESLVRAGVNYKFNF